MAFSNSDIFTSSVGRKFSETGCPIIFKGNTFLGHLERQGKGYV